MIPAVSGPPQPYKGEDAIDSSGGASDASIIEDMMEYMQGVINAESDNRIEMVEDLYFLAGKHWPEQMYRDRQVEARPALTINKLPTFLHQVTNDQRLNRPNIKIYGVDEGADDDTAKVLQGMIKYIEYNSNADVAEDRAVNSAAAIGIGYLRLTTDFESETSFNQEIRFASIRNSFTVYFDPLSTEPDGSDAKKCAISCDVLRKDFQKKYPKASAASPNVSPIKGTGDKGISWLSMDTVRLTEFYRIEEVPATLYLYGDGTTGWDKNHPAGVLKSRQSCKKKVMWYKCTAMDVLEKTEIPCDWIPVFPVYGDEIDVDGRVYRSGLIRWAKDPSRMYDYWMTAATEEVALRPKVPYIGAVGAFEDREPQWSQANRRSYSYLEYNPITVDGVLAPPPARQPMADIPSGMLTMAMHANDNIKATTGLFDSSIGAGGNAQSGVQERSQQQQGDVANYHYADNLLRTKRHVGRCILSMIPRIYDTERVVRILGDGEEMSSDTVNKQIPGGPPQINPETGEMMQAIQRVLNDVTVAKYDVVVGSGPSYSTMRQEAAAAMIEFGKNWPKLMDVAGDKVVKAMSWPGADEIAERIKKTIPPNLLEENEQQAIPPQVQEHLKQADQIIQMLQQKVAEQEQELKYSQEELATQKYKTDQDNKTRVTVEAMKQLAPLDDLISRIEGIEAAMGEVAGVLIPQQGAEQ